MISYFLTLLILFTPADKGDKIRKHNNKTAPPGTVWIRDSLYMDNAEVDNVSYREFLYNLKNQNKTDEYQKALPDTMVWKTALGYSDTYIGVYFRHPAYANYPLVGISYEQAVAFCEWRTEFVNKGIYKKANKLDWNAEVDYEKIPKYIRYRLPTREEWDYSARGGLKEADYPWGGYFLTNYQGEKMANFDNIGDECIAYSDSLKRYIVMSLSKPFTINDLYGITAPIKSYPPNGYGIYDIVGNVAEMIDEKGIAKGGSYKLPGYHCRLDQDWHYTIPSNHVGFRCVCDKLIDW